MYPKTKFKTVLLVLCFIALGSASAFGGIPVVEHVMVTDVTTVSFSVIWAASEPSTANLEVYADEGGTTQVSGAVIAPHPINSGDDSIKIAAENNGVMKVRVTGLFADTTYYFKTITTSKSTSESTTYPGAAPYMSVTTEVRTVRSYNSGGNELPFSNDIIIESCFLEDGSTPAEGSLLIATVKGAKNPITAFVGDGLNLPYALIDLNNAFSSESNENIDLKSLENLTLVNFRSLHGNSIVTHVVPEDLSLCEIKNGAPGLKGGWNFVSLQLEPNNPNIDQVLGSVFDKVSAVWTYSTAEDKWYKYLKEDPYGRTDLYEMHAKKGYWVLMADLQEDSIKVHGSFLTSDNIELSTGWNLIGYRSIKVVNLLTAIEPISDCIDAIWTYEVRDDDWYKYLKEDPYGRTDLYDLSPGKAYWILANSDCSWTLP